MMNEAQRAELFAFRKALDGFVHKIVENAAEINEHAAVIRAWTPGAYVVGDVRMYDGIPYKCVQAHDGEWTPDTTPALWMQYHGTSAATARPWIAPTGAHDMYKSGEYMIWTDGTVYRCLTDTVYSPVDYAQAWEGGVFI
jgi:hypothetical protein